MVTMLVTIYERRYNRFIAVKQYYQWNVPYTESRIPCPGCGQKLSYSNLQNSHRCDGKLTDNPIPKDRFKQNLKWSPTARWDPYVPD